MARKGKRDKPEKHSQGLSEQIEDPEGQGVRTKPRSKRKKSDVTVEDEGLDERTTAKIMKEARDQQEDLDAEANPFLSSSREAAEAEFSDSDKEDGSGSRSDAGEVWDEEVVEVSPEDEAAMAAFLNHNPEKQRTLADIILEKIQEKKDREAALQNETASTSATPDMNEKVVTVYKGVAQIMRRYTSGKVPKAFKIIPNLHNWEEVLFMTEPENWTPHATFQATRLFISNLNAKLAQRFLALVLLPHVRQDIQANKRLHFALFQAMKKATYKPDAFYKGLLLPLCQSGNCTLREAVIMSSVINRVSIPVLHSSAALLRLAEMPYSGTTSFFIRVLLDKKYALPYRVVDAVVDHFMRFLHEERTLPVVWHQSLLVFVQRYKHEIRKEDQQSLRKLLKVQYHYKVSPEIYRELDAARARGEKPSLDETMQVVSVMNSKTAENPKNMAPVIIMDEEW